MFLLHFLTETVVWPTNSTFFSFIKSCYNINNGYYHHSNFKLDFLMENFHSLSIRECLKELNSSGKGLTQKEAQKRLAKYGLNKIEVEKPLSKLAIFIEQFKSPLIYILLIAGLISVFFKEYIDAGVIFGAVILNTIIGFIQENKANNALSKLKQMVEHKALVVRDGQELEISSSEVALGDIVILEPGNRAPADARIISSHDLQITEASLTGEAIPSKKSDKKVSKGAPLADRESMVYASTVIVRGKGKAVVTAIGSNTEIGKIASLVKSTKEEKTPLQLRLQKLSRFLGGLVFFISLAVVLIGVWQGRNILEMFITGVAIAVASIPEGLAVAVTVILVIGMQRILKEKALTRKLVAAETLGSTTVICSDKTGTLTEGKMHVAHIVIGQNEFEISDLGSRQIEGEAKNVSMALQIGMMCNEAVIENPNDVLNEWRIIGSPTETALMLAAHESGLNKKELLQRESLVDTLPFDSAYKYMITLHKKGNRHILYEKGASEKLIEKSKFFFHKGKTVKLNSEEKYGLMKTYENLTSKGLRVIGVAYREIKDLEWNIDNPSWERIDKDLIFAGFIALQDPLRPEAKETIRICQRAGIRPVIITGDHKLTAKAIAQEVGFKVGAENILTGDALDNVDDKKLKKIVSKIDIYARVSPHHKLRIIKAWQSRGEVVAMTGDGINDSPALKAADIGISLGTGTDIAKETSDLVLLDNNFKTIVSAVREGRIIFANIRKVITYLVSDSFSEVILIVGSILLGMPLAILPTQILWINIVNDGFPNFALAFEKGSKDVMKEKPISKNEPIVNREMKVIIFAAGLIRDLFIFGLFLYLFRHHYELDYIRTVVFAAVGVDSLMYIFSLRSLKKPFWRVNPFSNLYLLGAVAISLFLLLIAIYWTPLQNILSTVPLGINSWMLISTTGIISIIMIEIIKHQFVTKERN